MSNPYYTHGSFPSTGAAATSASMRAELDLISAAFDKLPTLTSNANKFVVVNSTATGLTTTSTLPIASVNDSEFTFQDTADNTRKFQFAADAITPGATRLFTLPDANTTLVGTDTTQTLTNKTLTAPVIATIVNTGTLTLPTSTDTLVGRATTDTLTNKTLTNPTIGTILNTGTLTLPTSTDTLVGRATTDTLTNKTISGANNTLSNIANSSLTNSSVTIGSSSLSLGGTLTTLAGVTISGASNTLSNIANASLSNSSVTFNGVAVALGASGTITASTTNALTIGTGLQLDSGTTFNGGAARTLSIDSTVATLSGAQTLSNKTISGSSNTLSNIANASLTNSSITIGSSSISLGSTASTISGLTSLSSTGLVMTANAASSTAISAIAQSAGTVTVTAAGHGLTSGDLVSIDSVADYTYCGLVTVNVTNANVFTYSRTTTNASSSGGFVTKLQGTWASYSGGTGPSYKGGPLLINASSQLPALRVTQGGNGYALIVEDAANPDTSAFIIANDGSLSVNTNKFTVDAATGNTVIAGTLTLAGGINLNGNVTIGDASADTLTINSTITSNLIFTDNTYDIGASGATRPRNLFLAGNATIGGNQTLTGSLTVDSTTDSSSTTTGSIQTDGGLGVAKSAYFGGPNLRLTNAAPFLTVNNSSGGSAILELVSTGNWNWNIRGTATEQSFWRDSVNYWYWNSTNIVSSLNIIPSASSTYNLGSTSGYWNNLYLNYIKPVGGSAYTSTPFIDMYPSTNNLIFFHSGTPASDLNIGASGSAAGGNIPESVAYQATFSNGPGFLFSTAATAGGKLLSLTGSGVGIGKNSPSFALDIAPNSTSDGLMVRRTGTSATGFFVSGDGTVQWGNGTTDYGQLSWNTGYAIVGAKGSLYLTTNGGVSTVNALILGTSGTATFANNLVYPNGSYVSSGTFGRLWIPGQVIGSGYGGLYGQALTYNADYNSGWKSLGGGTATAITIDEGCFQLSKSNSVGAAGAALTWSPVIGTNGQQVGIGRYTPSTFTDLSITQNNTYGIGIDNTAGTQNYSWRIDSTNSNAWTFGTRTTSLDLYYVLPGGNAVYTQTGALRVHNGTTGQRPTASAGSIRWNTTVPQLEVGDGTQFQKVVTEAIVTATGGTVTTDGDYKIHTFTTSGTFSISAIAGAARALVEILVVGGGGGGGHYLGGGGGGGGFVQNFFYMTATSYSVTVGAGGAAVTDGYSYSSNGGASYVTGGTLGTLAYAYGGGAGGNGPANDAWGANGSSTRSIGSGGGGGGPYNITVTSATISLAYGGPAGYGGSGGGFGTQYSGSTFVGGGGGGGSLGAGVAPNIGNGPVGAGGYGGAARTSFIAGANVDYGGGGGAGYGTYLANTYISGGGGGGGDGVGSANSGSNLTATAGTANRGGGGGGGQIYSGYRTGGGGGSGVVIIRYKYQ